MRIAIITARGGSKRIPRKNIRCFLGKPIIAYPIAAARDCGLFDVVMVSTDDQEIAEIACQYGAQVPFMRSAETSADHATTADALLEVIRAYQQQGRVFETVCCLYPTAAFVTADTLRQAMMRFTQSGAEALIPVLRFSFPPLRGCVIQNDRVSMRWPEYERTRSQDLEPLYHDCGQFYLIKSGALQQQRTLICRDTVPMILDEMHAHDIDTEEDWAVAELKYQILQSRGKGTT